MLDLYRAELSKILGNRLVSALLVWLWPILGIVMPVVLLGIAKLASPGGPGSTLTFQWTDTALGAWLLVHSLASI